MFKTKIAVGQKKATKEVRIFGLLLYRKTIELEQAPHLTPDFIRHLI